MIRNFGMAMRNSTCVVRQFHVCFGEVEIRPTLSLAPYRLRRFERYDSRV